MLPSTPQLLLRPTTAVAAAVGYTAQGANFASTTNMHRGAALTGVTDSKIGLLSFWFRGGAASDAATIRFFDSLGVNLFLDRLSSNVMRVICQNSAGSGVISVSTTATFASADGWKHFLASWNLATATIQVYVEDVSDASITTNINDTIAYATNVTDWNFNTDISGVFDIADFWFDPNQVLDLSVSANRRKFISAGLAPVNLGATGSTPTGTQPAIFFSGAVGSWQTNKAAGGGFTVTSGSITAASNNPP